MLRRSKTSSTSNAEPAHNRLGRMAAHAARGSSVVLDRTSTVKRTTVWHSRRRRVLRIRPKAKRKFEAAPGIYLYAGPALVRRGLRHSWERTRGPASKLTTRSARSG